MCRSLMVYGLNSRLRLTGGMNARAFSDHKPVSLTLSVQVCRPEGGELPPIRRIRRPGFDVKLWRRYAAYFTPDDSRVLTSLQEVVQELGRREIDSTQAVGRIGDLLFDTMKRAFRLGRSSRVPDREHAPWWNEECAQTHAVMVSLHTAALASGRQQEAWDVYREARQAFNRARRRAQVVFEHKEWRDLINRCRGDPRELWQRLSGRGGESCPITDAEAWRNHFQALLNERQRPANRGRAVEILGFNNGAGRPLPWWQRLGQEEAERRKQIADAVLNTPITEEEVVTVLSDVPNGKSSGPERVCGECYRYAKRLRGGRDDPRPEINRLVPVLQALMEHIRSTGDYPSQFTVSDLVPVFKRGGRDPLVCGNYRGIAVGGVLAKCYAALLERRLASFADNEEGVAIRHWCQAGFRRGLGTQHHLFALRHFIARHARPGRSGLIVCQIDFEKAFDRVDRELLWIRLYERGIREPALSVFRKGYEKVELRVKANGQRGRAFDSVQGVKQGCPLSPMLFGLFIEAFAEYVDEYDRRSAQGGTYPPTAAGKGVPGLLYADDMTLMATIPARMQFLLDRLSEFCDAFGMSLNIDKCELLVFAGTQSAHDWLFRGAEALRFEGQPIPIKDRARYLGLRYGPGFAFDSCRMELCDVGRKAAFALMHQLDRNRIWVPDLMLRCFDVQVRSLLSYGVEVWGPDAVWEVLGTRGRQRVREWQRWNRRTNSGPAGENALLLGRWGRWIKSAKLTDGVFERALSDPMVEVQKLFLRKVAGASRPPNRQLFAEFSQLPLHHFWAQQVFNFWKRLCRQRGSLARAVLLEDIKAWLEAGQESEYEYFWAGKVLRILQVLGYDYREHIDESSSVAAKAEAILGLEIPFDDVLEEFRRRLLADWQSPELDQDPRSFPEAAGIGGAGPGRGVTACRYSKWMGVVYSAGKPKDKVSHAGVSMPREHHKALMRFRLGCWDLEVYRLAHGPGRKPRAERTCRVCGGNEVEDEYHVLMECQVYAPLRQGAGLPTERGMQDIMRTADQAKLGSLLWLIQRVRKAHLGG